MVALNFTRKSKWSLSFKMTMNDQQQKELEKQLPVWVVKLAKILDGMSRKNT